MRRIFVEEHDFTIEEVFDDSDACTDTDTSILLPEYEDADSDWVDGEDEETRLRRQGKGLQEQLEETNIISNFEALCGGPNGFDHASSPLERSMEQERKYRRKKKRWSQGQYYKRTYSQSMGSDTDGDEDLDPLMDINEVGSSARRLRRRTGELGSPLFKRGSLLFEDVHLDMRVIEVDEPDEEGRPSVKTVEPSFVEQLPFWSVEELMDLDDSSDEEVELAALGS
jgi:Ni/Co efflux regulator RcnB